MTTKGYKVFNPDWTCRNFQYEVGKTYEHDKSLIICEQGFHFCKKAADCFGYYNFDPKNKVAEIIAHGDVIEADDKCVTNKIEIVREIPWAELLEIANTGKGNSGLSNSGNSNSGNYNSGYRNSGYRNSGDYNSGNCNSGHYNSGNCNSGNCNSGNYNSGYHNNGDYNIGDGNIASQVIGCFNTKSQDLLIFDTHVEGMTLDEWRNSDACRIWNRVNLYPVQWVASGDMTDDDKENYPEHITTGGYLKKRDTSNCFRDWWNELNDADRATIKNIPNFDPDKFKLITGIEV